MASTGFYSCLFSAQGLQRSKSHSQQPCSVVPWGPNSTHHRTVRWHYYFWAWLRSRILEFFQSILGQGYVIWLVLTHASREQKCSAKFGVCQACSCVRADALHAPLQMHTSLSTSNSDQVSVSVLEQNWVGAVGIIFDFYTCTIGPKSRKKFSDAGN